MNTRGVSLAKCFLALAPIFLSLISLTAKADSLSELSQSFWQWRAVEQPFTNDDIPRIDRPADFRIDWTTATISARRKDLTAFETRWKTLAPSPSAPIPQQVDYRLLGSAIARVEWELNINREWQRNPVFYVDQTLGSLFVLLMPPPPFDAQRQAQLISRLQSFPATLDAARENRTDMRKPFAQLAIEALDDLPNRFNTMLTALTPQLDPATAKAIKDSAPAAISALESYRDWLKQKLPTMREETAIGCDNYIYFLRNVALMPYTPEQLLSISRQEWDRTVAFESYEQARNTGLPPMPIFPNQQAQIEREEKNEAEIRAFLGARHILTVPSWMKHYRNLPLPAYVAPFSDLGVTDDLTGPSRLDQNGTSYIRVPSPSLGYFNLSTARDPRPIIVHEGVPGHYFQLCLSWANSDPIRRRYYDSGANEGIGFYAEEMMLQAGLFDDSPRTREIIYSFMRLRALRVEVDVKLATGEFTLEQAADYLSKTVPMDHGTAIEEAAMFSSTPGQAISYQIGKIQIMRLLADTRQQKGEKFSLQSFHDFVWTNGNVPLSLQRWELLNDPGDLPPAPDFAASHD
ncbi:DUF885 domain-containing protein [Acidobacterium sp. S8]|uniref:DUF885 domain-containing protein n=1 Tax=Acidobacterium sp. S8 TaxID=1641854 RepID=UPI00131C6DBE|nr:DUF885 domain-containing protein [Acidobacterium sp. S8]